MRHSLQPKRRSSETQSETESEGDYRQRRQRYEPPRFVKNHLTKIDHQSIIVNISRTKYEIVEEVAEELGWRVETSRKSEKWDIMWIDSHIESHDLFKLHEHQKISHFPAIYVLTKKNFLGRSLMKMSKMYPQHYNFFPFTWSIPAEYTELNRYDKQQSDSDRARYYIYKPEALAQGKGIKIYDRVQSLQNLTGIVQTYIENPLLIENLKFDLRIYVLIMGYNPIRIFIYDEGLGRFATKKYEKVRRRNMKEVMMHLTNYAVNKNNSNFIFNRSEFEMDKGHKRSLTAVYNYLQTVLKVDVGVLKHQIDEIIIKTLMVGQPMIAHAYGLSQSTQHFNDLCFQILGFDMLINDQFKPILLEVNHTPSFQTDTPLDKHIKKNLIKDTFRLLNVNTENKKESLARKKEFMEMRSQGKFTKVSPDHKEKMRSQKWKQVEEYEGNNLGQFRKIYPTVEAVQKFQDILGYATKIFNIHHGFKSKSKRPQAQSGTSAIDTNQPITRAHHLNRVKSHDIHQQQQMNNIKIEDQSGEQLRKQGKKNSLQNGVLANSPRGKAVACPSGLDQKTGSLQAQPQKQKIMQPSCICSSKAQTGELCRCQPQKMECRSIKHGHLSKFPKLKSPIGESDLQTNSTANRSQLPSLSGIPQKVGDGRKLPQGREVRDQQSDRKLPSTIPNVVNIAIPSLSQFTKMHQQFDESIEAAVPPCNTRSMERNAGPFLSAKNIGFENTKETQNGRYRYKQELVINHRIDRQKSGRARQFGSVKQRHGLLLSGGRNQSNHQMNLKETTRKHLMDQLLASEQILLTNKNIRNYQYLKVAIQKQAQESNRQVRE